jgi:hypothetical protein
MINDNIKATGELTVVLRDENGNIKEERKIPNLVVTVGKNFIASRMTSASAAVMSHMGVGSTNTAPSASDTALAAALGTRAALTTAGGTANANVVTFNATFAAGVGTGAIVEAGIFNASTAGTMLARTIFSVVNKDAADTLSVSWALTIS